jgi:hypothetical protein
LEAEGDGSGLERPGQCSVNLVLFSPREIVADWFCRVVRVRVQVRGLRQVEEELCVSAADVVCFRRFLESLE